jgi:hypothetical protein
VLKKNNGQDAVTATRNWNVFGHNPPPRLYNIWCGLFGVINQCKLSQNKQFDYNFVVDIDLPAEAWIKFRALGNIFWF